ncbi:MAG: PorV/PorQ family protein, partial [Endomicrobiia bacterium]|nr:PorV/PorQ family protein [Endomicrobiia bacterium]
MRKTGHLATIFPMVIHRYACSLVACHCEEPRISVRGKLRDEVPPRAGPRPFGARNDNNGFAFRRALVFTIYSLLFTIHPLYAAGTAAAEFLKVTPGVRAAAMGGAFTALADDKTAIYYNPAGLSQLRWREVAMSYDKWILDTSLANLTYAHTFGLSGSAALGVTYYDSGAIEKRGDTKDSGGSFKHTGMAARAAYGNEFFEGVSLGAALKYVGETLDADYSGGFAGDIGVHYKTIFDFGETSFGAAAQNVGTKIWDEYDMPLLIRAGAAVKPSKDFMTVAVEYVAPQAGIPYAALGFEITPGPL